MKTGRLIRVVAVMLGMACVASMASAQALNSGAQTIALNANLTESLTVAYRERGEFHTCGRQRHQRRQHQHYGTTTWALKASRTAVAVDAYFASAAAALTDGAGDNIPSSAFFIADNGGASTALINTVAFGAANAGLQLANVPITAANRSARAPTSWLSTST